MPPICAVGILLIDYTIYISVKARRLLCTHNTTMVHKHCHMNIVDLLTKFGNECRVLCRCKAQVHVVDSQKR